MKREKKESRKRGKIRWEVGEKDRVWAEGVAREILSDADGSRSFAEVHTLGRFGSTPKSATR